MAVSGSVKVVTWFCFPGNTNMSYKYTQTHSYSLGLTYAQGAFSQFRGAVNTAHSSSFILAVLHEVLLTLNGFPNVLVGFPRFGRKLFVCYVLMTYIFVSLESSQV